MDCSCWTWMMKSSTSCRVNDHLLWFLKCFEKWFSCCCRKNYSNVSKHHLMDYWLPDRLTTVCEIGPSSVWFSDVQQDLHGWTVLSWTSCTQTFSTSLSQDTFRNTLMILQRLDLLVMAGGGVWSTGGWFCDVIWKQSSAGEKYKYLVHVVHEKQAELEDQNRGWIQRKWTDFYQVVKTFNMCNALSVRQNKYVDHY